MESRVRIVLVDDHPLLRDGLNARLSRERGFEIVGEAATADAALALLEHTPADVVITDLSLGERDGADLTANIVQRHADTAVLVFTMYSGEHDVSRAMCAGARGYVLKTDSGTSLIAAVHSVVQGAIYLSPAVAHLAFGSSASERRVLTPRESEILDLLGEGLSTKQVAQALRIETQTVQAHRLTIKRKLRLNGQTALIKYAADQARERRR